MEDNLRTERVELITQADILGRLVHIQDELYMIRRTLDAILEQLAQQRQEMAVVDYNKRQN
jgi:hypothetical protein